MRKGYFNAEAQRECFNAEAQKGHFNAEAQRRRGAEKKRVFFPFLKTLDLLSNKTQNLFFSLCAFAPLRLCVKMSFLCLCVKTFAIPDKSPYQTALLLSNKTQNFFFSAPLHLLCASALNFLSSSGFSEGLRIV